jgi:hypothetical protein
LGGWKVEVLAPPASLYCEMPVTSEATGI